MTISQLVATLGLDETDGGPRPVPLTDDAIAAHNPTTTGNRAHRRQQEHRRARSVRDGKKGR